MKGKVIFHSLVGPHRANVTSTNNTLFKLIGREKKNEDPLCMRFIDEDSILCAEWVVELYSEASLFWAVLYDWK